MKANLYLKIMLTTGLVICFVSKIQAQANEAEQATNSVDKQKAIAETVNLSEEKIGSQGNWVRKKEWLKEAIKINEEIQKLIPNIQKAKQPYAEKSQQIDGELDTFYKQEGVEQGKLQELFVGIEKYLQKKKLKEIERLKSSGEQEGFTGELEIKINLIEQEIEKHKNELDQLKLDMQSIGDLDKSLHDRLRKVDEQISIAHNQANQAEKLTDEIWYIIDDKKAKENFYELKGKILEKIKVIQTYLQTDLLNDFENVISNIKTQINKVKEEIKALEEKELIIRNRAQRIEKIKREELETLRTEKAAQEKALKDAAAAKLAQQPWYSKVYNYFINFFAKIYLFVTNIFGGTKISQPTSTISIESKPVEKKEPATQAEQTAPQDSASEKISPQATTPAPTQTNEQQALPVADTSKT